MSFENELYEGWRRKRIAVIEQHYGPEWFEGKRILELGAGHGQIGTHFLRLGSSVTFVEGRKDHADYIREHSPGVEVACMDLNSSFPTGSFDLTVCMGVLYHVVDPGRLLSLTLKSSDRCVIESVVADSFDDEVITVGESSGYDQALDTSGSRPSETFIRRIMCEENHSFTQLNEQKLNYGVHVYDWPLTGKKERNDGQRRFWFTGRKK